MSEDDGTTEPPGRRQAREDADKLRAEREGDTLQTRIDELEASRMPLMEHLIELRDRVVYSLIALVLGAAVGFWFSEEVYFQMTMPFVRALEDAGVEGGLALVTSPFEGIYTYIRMALIIGLLLASPIVSFNLWAFIGPGLYKAEKRIVLPLSLTSAGLFVLGAGFCFYIIFPYAFPFFITVLNVPVSLSVDAYLQSVLRMMLAFGLSFQLPVATFFLSVMGLVDHKQMLHFFKYAVVAIFFVSAVITPPDPLTQMLLAIPLIVLYCVSIGVAWMFSTRKPPEDTPVAM